MEVNMNTGQQKSNGGWSLLKTAIVGAGAVAGAIASIITCLALFGLNPLARLQPTPTPVLMTGELSKLDLEFVKNFGDYVGRQSFMLSSDYSESELQSKGVIVHFVAKITGFKGQPCSIRWGVYDSVSQELLSSSTIRYELTLTPETDTDQASAFIWVASPQYIGTYHARLELYDPDGIRLDYADSVDFLVK
jgi:hypothetical protein